MKANALIAILLLAVVSAGGCGSGDSTASDATATTAADASRPERTNYSVMRDKVVLGLAKDFRSSTKAGPPRYGLCVRLGVGRRLTRKQLDRLVAIYGGQDGQSLAAQELNALAAPVGARCGGAKYMPELVQAAEALGARYPLSPLAIAAGRLGVVYGPFLGVTCRKANSTRCDRVGIDVVLRRDARAVTVSVGGRKVVLRTPGPHSGEAGRDWVGFIDRVGLRRPGSPFQVPARGRKVGHWAGSPSVYLPLELEIVHPDGRTVTGTLQRVPLRPGWG